MSDEMNLHVVTSDGAAFDRALDGESFVIGRSSKADLTVPDRSMSRMHARIFRDDGTWHDDGRDAVGHSAVLHNGRRRA